MVLVMCDMCEEIHDLDNWTERNCFICKACAEALSEIRRTEIDQGWDFLPEVGLGIFDKMRGIES